MAGRPLIYYSVSACLQTPAIDRVVVSTDDEEVALFARRFGAHVLLRPSDLAGDTTTLDPVIEHALTTCENDTGSQFEIVVTVQPTSPLIGQREIGSALRKLQDDGLDTVLSVVDDRHLCWTEIDGKPSPEYSERVNRQFLPPRFRETGAIIACRSEVLRATGSRVGKKVGLVEVEQEKSFDIDTVSDFLLCENLLLRKRVLFHIMGNQTVGLGHAYRSLMLANELVGHKLAFLCTEEHRLAADLIAERNFPVTVCAMGDVMREIEAYAPHLVINDILDTDASFICELKQRGIGVVNFEDLGSGMEHADLVVNALYPPSKPMPNVRWGPEYFCLRDEFLHQGERLPAKGKGYVLLCFGGVDEGNLSSRVLEVIYPECRNHNLAVTVVLGQGYLHRNELDATIARLRAEDVEVVTGTPAISEYMLGAEFAITSGGRTVFELAALCKPTIVICQNERETTHSFGQDRAGVLNLGHRADVSDNAVREAFVQLATNESLRAGMCQSLAKTDLTGGKSRVMALIRELLEATDVR